MSSTKDAQERAVRAETKEERARDAAQAMHEYQKEKLAVLARTARLRAERLAKEADEALQAKTQPKEKR
jgi:phosphotransacetylase